MDDGPNGGRSKARTNGPGGQVIMSAELLCIGRSTFWAKTTRLGDRS